MSVLSVARRPALRHRRPRLGGAGRRLHPVPAWYLAIVALSGLQRLRELQLSRSNLAQGGGAQAARSTYPLMVALHVALFTAPLAEAGLRGRAPRLRAALAWSLVLAAATGLRWWSISSLGRSWNVQAVVPADVEPVVSGPYRWIRHPNYLAVILEFAAVPMAGGAWVSAVVLSLLDGFVLAKRIEAEERLLSRSSRYREAFAGRSRLIPGVF